MLQNIREKSQSWFAWLIILAICAIFALWGIHNYISGKTQDDIATVNGKSITLKEVNHHYQRLKQRELKLLQNNADVLPLHVNMQLKRQALDVAISQRVLTEAANKEGYVIDDNKLRDVLASIPAFQVEGVFNEQRFMQVLNDINETPQNFVQEVQKALLQDQVRRGVMSSAFVMPKDANQAVRLIEQRRDITYTLISPDHFIHRVAIDENEIKDYYRKHAKLFIVPEKIRVAYVVLDMAAIEREVTLTNSALKLYYDQNISLFTKPKRWHFAHIQISVPNNASKEIAAKAQQKAQSVVQQLKNGADFSKMAQTYSDDVVSARLGGELGWFDANNMDAAIKVAIDESKSKGAISSPIKTNYGLAIYKLLEVKEENVEPFAQVAELIKHELLKQKAEQKFYEVREELASLTFSHPDSLEFAAKRLNLKTQLSGWLTQDGSENKSESGFETPQIMSAAFSDEVLKQHNNSQVLELDPERLMVLRLAAHQKATLRPFMDVSAQIRAQLREEKTRREAKMYGEKIVAALNRGASLERVMKQYDVRFASIKNIKRTSKEFEAKFIEEIFRLPREAKQDTYYGFTVPSGEYVVAHLDNVTDGHYEYASIQEKQFIQKQLEDGFGQLDYAFYVQSSLKAASIEIENEDLNIV